MSVLEVKGLKKRYGNLLALAGIDLSVRRGEVFGFLGPNGAGKTTFTKCVTGFVKADAGDVRLMGIDALRDPTSAAYHVGLVPDQYDFYPNLTGRQHLDFYGRLMGMESEERRTRIEETLELVRMQERADTKTKGYSHGMKQRICIAQAILHRPDIVFFDEPTNGLDPKGAYELREMIRSFAKEGHTVFLNSHLLHEVEQTCERVAIMDRGRMLAMERVDDLRKRFSGAGGVFFRFANPSQKVLGALESAAGAVHEQDGAYHVAIQEDAVPDAVARVVKAGGQVLEVRPGTASLENVFLQMTADAEGAA